MVMRMSALCCLAVVAWDVVLNFQRSKVITSPKILGEPEVKTVGERGIENSVS